MTRVGSAQRNDRDCAALSDSFLQEVKRRASVASLIGARVVLKKKGRALLGLCPFHAERTPSFYVYPDDGHYHCFGCGATGDAVSWVRHDLGLSFPAAVRELALQAGMIADDGVARPPSVWRAPSFDPERAAAQAAADKAKSKEKAWAIWARAFPASGTLVETYLRHARGITCPVPASLRFLHDEPYWSEGENGRPDVIGRFPVMVAPFVREENGRRVLTGVHMTYLRADGTGKAAVPSAKKMRGEAWGSAIRLAAVEGAAVLGISEGIETGLSVMSVRPDIPVWAAGSLGNIAGAGLPVSDEQKRPHPTKPGRFLENEEPDQARPGMRPPPGVRRVLILADADGDSAVGATLIERAVRRFKAWGLDAVAVFPPAGRDFNDLLRERRGVR
jgi:DNA primase